MGDRPEDDGLVTPAIASLAPYRAGPPWRLLARELGLDEDQLLMLAANENVLGPSRRAIEAAQGALFDAHLYPDGVALLLRRAIAERYGTQPEQIVVGNGSNELIELLVRTFVGPKETVVGAWPSFVVYRLVTQAEGREMLIAPLRDDRYDLTGMLGLIDRRTKVVFIANPNNPTGTYVSRRALTAFLERVPSSVIVVLDEAYAEYVTATDYPDGTRELLQRPRTVILRTFSKAYGLAGLRVGYGIMEPKLAHHLDAVRQPYNVNNVAQAAALAALFDTSHVDRSRAMVAEGRATLERGLRSLGFEVVPSQANFLLARLGRPTQPLVDVLRREGLLVRDMKGYDMPTAIRVTVGTPAMNARLLAGIEAAL